MKIKAPTFITFIVLSLASSLCKAADSDYTGVYVPAGRDGRDWDCISVGKENGAIEVTKSSIIGPDINCQLLPTSYPNQKNFPMSDIGGELLDIKCEGKSRSESISIAKWESFSTHGIYILGDLGDQKVIVHQYRSCQDNPPVADNSIDFNEVKTGETGDLWFTPYPLGNGLSQLIFTSQTIVNKLPATMFENSRSSTRKLNELINSLPQKSSIKLSARSGSIRGADPNSFISKKIDKAVSYSERANYILPEYKGQGIRSLLNSINPVYSISVEDGGEFEGLVCYVEMEYGNLRSIPGVSNDFIEHGIPEIKTNGTMRYSESPTPLCRAVYASSTKFTSNKGVEAFNDYVSFHVFTDKNINSTKLYAGDLLLLNGKLRRIGYDSVTIELKKISLLGEEIINKYHYPGVPEFK